MNEKSHVSVEQHVCMACGSTYDTGAVLLDRRLRASMDRHTVTGWGLCANDQRLYDDGFVALVECDPEKSGVASSGDSIKPEVVWRTGRVCHLKREMLLAIVDIPIGADRPVVFVETGVLDKIAARFAP